MKVIHVTWDMEKSFKNTGNLYLWVEHHRPIKKDKYYPHQFNNKSLDEFVKDYLGSVTFSPATLGLNFIVNKKGKYIPSPIISNLIDFEDTEVHSFNKAKLYALKVTSTLNFLKTLLNSDY